MFHTDSHRHGFQQIRIDSHTFINIIKGISGTLGGAGTHHSTQQGRYESSSIQA